MEQSPDTGNGSGPALRLARRSPRLAAQLTRSLLAERRRVRRERGERLPLRRVLAPGGAQELARHGGRVDPGFGFAYTALQRRMRAIGIEIPPPERLMPGPIDSKGLAGNRTTAVPVAG